MSAIPKAEEFSPTGATTQTGSGLPAKRGIVACIPGKSNRKLAIPSEASLYNKRHKIKNMFARLKDWRRVRSRDDRCAHTYFSAICIAADVVFQL